MILETNIYRVSTSEMVPARVMLGMNSSEISAVEMVWRQARYQLSFGAEHAHWDWNWKSQLVNEKGVECIGLLCENEIQGMMLVTVEGHYSRHESTVSLPLLYIDFIEVAPWNLPSSMQRPMFRNVGKCLIETASAMSVEIGFGGRIGLHSLAQSESYYKNVCGFHSFGFDTGNYFLTYFESVHSSEEVQS